MKNLVCHNVDPQDKTKKLWGNNGMVHFIALFTLPAGVYSIPLSLKPCQLHTSQGILAWFPKTGMRSRSAPSYHLSVFQSDSSE